MGYLVGKHTKPVAEMLWRGKQTFPFLSFWWASSQCASTRHCKMARHSKGATCTCTIFAIFGRFCPPKPKWASFGVFLAGPCPQSCITPQFRPLRAPVLKTNGQFGFGGAPQSFHALSWVPIAPPKAAPAHFGRFLAGPCPKNCIAPQFRPTRAPILKTNGQFASGMWLHEFCLLGANCTT